MTWSLYQRRATLEQHLEHFTRLAQEKARSRAGSAR